MAITTGTTGIVLPTEVSDEVWAKVQQGSTVMRLSNKIDLPYAGAEVPMITGDPTAAWVEEGKSIAVSEGTYSHKKVKGYKMSVIVPFSNEFLKNEAKLYDAIIQRVPLAMAQKFDSTVFGVCAAPGTDFDQITAAGEADIEADTWAGLVAADEAISAADGVINGFVFSTKGKSLLLGSLDKNGRPIFVQDAAAAAHSTILGAATYFEKGVYKPATTSAKAVYGYAGDWTSACYGVHEDVSFDVSNQSTLTLPDGTNLNLWQNDMFACKIEFNVGWRYKWLDQFCKLTGAAVASE